MVQLPVEAWGEVVQQVEFSDLKPLRLVSKLFADLASKELFHKICFMLLPDSVMKLRRLAAHPTLRPHVEKYIMSGTALIIRTKIMNCGESMPAVLPTTGLTPLIWLRTINSYTSARLRER